jgi:thioredoxin 1
VKALWVLLAILVLGSCALADQQGEGRLVSDVCSLLNTGPLARAHVADLPEGVVLRAGEITISQTDVETEITKAPSDLRQQLTRNRLLVLEQLVVKRLLALQAEQWAKTTKREANETEAVRIQAYLASIAAGVTVTDADLRRFYDENKEMLGGASFEQVRPQLSSYVLRQRRDEAKRRHIDSVGERVRIEVAKTWTDVQYRQLIDNPVDRARLSGLPSVIDFGAEGCVACDMMAPVLALLRDELKGNANVLFVDVRKEQVLGSRFGVRTIPLQVFFDRNGKEVFRHIGVFPEAQIRAKLAELGGK